MSSSIDYAAWKRLQQEYAETTFPATLGDGMTRWPGAATSALHQLRQHQTVTHPPIDWQDDPRHNAWIATIEHDGFVAHLKLEDEEYPDLSWVGSFDDRYAPDAIVLQGAYFYGRRENHKYFHPENPSHARDYFRTGASKHVRDCRARAANHQDLKLAQLDGYADLQVSVEVYAKGVEHELGSRSCGGITVSDDWYRPRSEDREHIDEIAWDCVDEAIDEAKRAVRELRDFAASHNL